MSGFHSSFRSFGTDGFDAAHWRPYFLPYDPVAWEKEGGGVLTYTAGGLEYSLTVCHVPVCGFFLKHSCYDHAARRSVFCQFAVVDRSKLARFVTIDDLTFPAGCFLTAAKAWLGVEDFLLSPEQASARLEWVDDADVAWPDHML